MNIPDLKIREIRARAVSVPLRRPLGTSAAMIRNAPLVLFDVETEEGVTGRAYAFGLSMSTAPIRAAVPDILAAIKGERLAPVGLHARLEGRFRLFGLHGHLAIALACVDVACWDALARAAGVPLVRLLGGAPRAVPAYNSNGMSLGEPARLADEAEELLAEGFSAIKLRLGYPTLEGDLAAVRAVKRRIPASATLMTDYNQALTPAEAVRRARALDDEGVYWIEEPVRHDDYAGAAHVAHEAATPIQIGENFVGSRTMAAALAMHACDYVMPDLQRIGGVTGWLRAAALADAAGMEMSSHLFPEVSAHLLAVTPTCHWLEYVDWAAAILAEPLAVKDGYVAIPDRPGNGLEWDAAAVARYAVE